MRRPRVRRPPMALNGGDLLIGFDEHFFNTGKVAIHNV
jgi:hypothetical protein